MRQNLPEKKNELRETSFIIPLRFRTIINLFRLSKMSFDFIYVFFFFFSFFLLEALGVNEIPKMKY